MKKLRMYLEFSRISFQRSSVYRFDAWTRLLSNLMFLMMWGFIWYALYSGKAAAGGRSFQVMLSYVMISQLLSGLHSAATPLWEIQERVRNGDIVMEIVRPFDYPLRVLFSDFGSMAFHFLAAIVPLYLVLFLIVHPVLPTSILQWAGFIAAAILGFLIRYSIELTFGLFTFWLIETGGVEDIFYFSISLLSGTTVPLWFFPGWLKTAASFLPFQGIFFIPNSIFVGQIQGIQIGIQLLIQLFWLGVTYVIMRAVWNQALAKIVVQGG